MNERDIKIYLKGVKDGLMAATDITDVIAEKQINMAVNIVKKGRQAKSKIPNSQRYMKYISKSGKVSYKPNPNWDGTPSNKSKKTDDGLAILGQKSE